MPAQEPADEAFAPVSRGLGTLTSEQQNLIGSSKNSLDTPALVLDLDRFERNAMKLAGFFRDNGVHWRPHSKSHKSPQIARRQVELGAIGVTCAKVSEAEVMVEHGIGSVLIANEQGRRTAFDRIAALNRHAQVITCADSPVHVELASAAAVSANVVIPILVSVDVGQHRSGVTSSQDALRLAQLIQVTPGLAFLGLMGFEGHLVTVEPPEEKDREVRAALRLLTETAKLIKAAGLNVKIVSGGGSATYSTSGRVEGMTEIQAGGACFLDCFYGESCHMDDLFEYALTITSVVTSRPAPERALTDAGFKTMSDNQMGRPRPIGRPGVTLERLAAEHGILKVEPMAQDLAIGDRIEWIPGYGDTTTFLHDAFVGVRGDRVAAVLPLVGRGRLT